MTKKQTRNQGELSAENVDGNVDKIREIIEHHGGKIMVESTPGIGSRLWFRLSTGEVPERMTEP